MLNGTKKITTSIVHFRHGKLLLFIFADVVYVQPVQVWKAISNEMNAAGYCVTGEQCWTKWKGLKARYKAVARHNKKSGNGRKRWELFDVSCTYFNINACNTKKDT